MRRSWLRGVLWVYEGRFCDVLHLTGGGKVILIFFNEAHDVFLTFPTLSEDLASALWWALRSHVNARTFDVLKGCSVMLPVPPLLELGKRTADRSQHMAAGCISPPRKT